MQRWRLRVLLLVASLTPAAALAEESIARWRVSEAVSPLTNRQIVAAVLGSRSSDETSPEPLASASLVIRCDEGVMSSFVGWPTALRPDSYTLFKGVPEAKVMIRLDDGEILLRRWQIGVDGFTAGEFDTKAAAKLLEPMMGRRRLVVRLGGLAEQDAVFDLGDIDEAAAKVTDACQLRPLARPIDALAPQRPEDPLAVARRMLEAAGFKVERRDSTSQTFWTAAVVARVTPKLADCGEALGVGYILDGGADATVAYEVSDKDGMVKVSSIITPIDEPGRIAPRGSMRCVSSGALEHALLRKIQP